MLNHEYFLARFALYREERIMRTALKRYTVSCLVVMALTLVATASLAHPHPSVAEVITGGAYLALGFLVGGLWSLVLDTMLDRDWSTASRSFCALVACWISTALVVSIMFSQFGESYLFGALAQAASTVGCLVWFSYAGRQLTHAE